MYSLSVGLQRISLRSTLKMLSSASAGLLLMILRMATFSSLDSFRSGATEKKRLNFGSVNSSKIKMMAELKVL